MIYSDVTCHDRLMFGPAQMRAMRFFDDVAAIRTETRRMIREVDSEGGLLIGSSTEIVDDISLANYLAFRNEAMKG
jgi:hypothetical protein